MGKVPASEGGRGVPVGTGLKLTPELHMVDPAGKYVPRTWREWVRPDLNRSRQHPKLVGFLAGGETVGGPRVRTKLPHGPAGALEGLRG